VSVTLAQERCDRAEQINPDGRHEDRHERVPEPTMRRTLRPQNVTKLGGSSPEHSMGICNASPTRRTPPGGRCCHETVRASCTADALAVKPSPGFRDARDHLGRRWPWLALDANVDREYDL
jgi:hypothetical protein